jgi:hypothetical protein
MRRVMLGLPVFLLFSWFSLYASVFGRVQGVVHDAQHRPVRGVEVTLHAAHSDFSKTTLTNDDGAFSFGAVSLGDYSVTAAHPGFANMQQMLTLASDTSPVLHLQLQVAMVRQSVTTTSQAAGSDVDSATPTTLIDRRQIDQTPGADRTDSLAMITDYVPGAYITHDMLHMRGGHQVSWEIDGVQIPNTNIASNLGAQIDPKDINYLEVERGSYTADIGDRTYGVFDVVPKSGFDGTREGAAVLSAGSFLQTNDQLSFESHTEKFAYYTSLTGNRSDYGLSPPTGVTVHDAANGYGGFLSLIDNRTPKDQLRLVTQLRTDFFEIPYDPNPKSLENQEYDSYGLRDAQHELDGLVAFTWAHSFSASGAGSGLLQISPFYHYNSADYAPKLTDYPVATTSNRASNYGGLQTSVGGEIAGNTLQAGLYSFGQRDNDTFGSVFNDGSYSNFSINDAAAGGVVEEFFSDNYKAAPWLTMIAGIRGAQFRSSIADNAVDPRFGVALEVPKLHWVFRAFYGRFYQPPPLLTASGPIVGYANSENTAFAPLHGERDEEHQFGVQIPWRGWLLDADTFKTRANDFLDHSNVGESSIYYPVTVDGALIQAWELTLRSPELREGGSVHLAYSNQLAQQRGAITGGLICYPISSAACDAGFGYTPLDHDQRNTLNVGYDTSLPWRGYASTNVYYGSGFTNGMPNVDYPGPYLPQHTTFDFSLGKTVGERTTVSVSAVNLANRRVLLDNSLTFGGFHYNDPRQIYGEVRYHFHY